MYLLQNCGEHKGGRRGKFPLDVLWIAQGEIDFKMKYVISSNNKIWDKANIGISQASNLQYWEDQWQRLKSKMTLENYKIIPKIIRMVFQIIQKIRITIKILVRTGQDLNLAIWIWTSI